MIEFTKTVMPVQPGPILTDMFALISLEERAQVVEYRRVIEK